MNTSWDTVKLAAIVVGVLAVIAIDAALVMLIPRRKQERWFLGGAAVYNLLGGFALLLVSIGILLGFKEPPLDLSSADSRLIFQLLLLSLLFAGWTIVIFGFGYLQSARGKAPLRTFLLYGGAMKYWVFLIGATFFCLLPDIDFFVLSLPDAVLVFGGLPNLLFAILFSILFRRSKEESL